MFPFGIFTTSPGTNVTFNCIHSSPFTVVRVQWRVNDTQVDNTTLQNVGTVFHENIGIGSLLFSQIPPHYNLSVIRCEALLNSGRIVASNNIATIILHQGTWYINNCLEINKMFIIMMDSDGLL